MSEKALEVTEREFQQEVLEEGKPVLVDFWAPWCGPCQKVLPVVDELAAEYGDKVKIVKVNIDENPNIPSQYDVMGVPTLMIFKNGEAVDSVTGARNKKDLASFIDNYLS